MQGSISRAVATPALGEESGGKHREAVAAASGGGVKGRNPDAAQASESSSAAI
jgi:hypothetical protein